MSLFIKKNPNETAYTGGKKHFADVIKNSGSGELLIWRQPEEDFNTNSTLIVMPGEEALFIKDGKIEQTFQNGTYKLSTENYPFISRLRTAFTGGISTFNCVVYFVRKAHSMEIKWGTDSPIQVRDKVMGIATKLKARGSYKVEIDNPTTFLEKLIGNNVIEETQPDLNKYFSNEFQSKIKTTIATEVNESDQEILGIDSRLEEFSSILQPRIDAILNEYGLKCVSFAVAAVDIDDDELRRRYDEQKIEINHKAEVQKEAMNTLGDKWTAQQQVDIMKDMANNEGSGGAVAGMGMGLAAGGAIGTMAGGVFNQNAPVASNDFYERLTTLKKMLDTNLITQEEYDSKKADILSKM